MGATTPVLALPYPVGTDRVMDGDNAIQALAERIEARLPRGVLAYALGTGGAGIVTQTDLPGMSKTITATAGRMLRVTAFLPSLSSTVAGDIARLMILEDNVVASQGHLYCAKAGEGFAISLIFTLTPSVGSHTYKVALLRSQGTGTLANNVGGGFTASLTIEDIGSYPAPF